MHNVQTKLRKIQNTAWSETTDTRLLALFTGLDGFGQILFFWGLMCSLLAGLALLLIALSQASYWALASAAVSLRCYLYLGRIGKELIDKLIPSDG